MVILAVEVHQFSLKVGAYAGKDGLQVIKHFPGKDAPTVFCDKDQMHVKREYAVSACTNIIVFGHRPNIIQA